MADHEHPFPSDESLHDPFADETAALLQSSYAALPPAPAAQVDRAVQYVLRASSSNAAGISLSVQVEHTRQRARSGGRWWWGAAAAAVLVVVVMRPWRPDATLRDADSTFAAGRASLEPSGSTREETGGTVRFEFTLPAGAQQVALVGDFNGWDDNATPMVRREREGTWSASVPLEPGRHEYAFVVDGTRWLVDPLAPQVADAGFGPTNTVVVDGPAAPAPGGKR